MIKIQKTPSDRPAIKFVRGPRKGKDKLIEATKELIKRYNKYKSEIDKNKKSFTFDSSLYAHHKIKNKLKELQHDKCCFCEAKLTHTSHGDVEHFRPKKAYKQNDKDKYLYPGYFWLAYNWENLFFSCQLCNQRHKGNLFPLFDKTSRMLNYNGKISSEKYIFIHPSLDNPEEHITFNYEVPIPKNSSKRGELTINKLGLNRIKLNEHRLTQLKDFLDLINIIKLFPDIPEMKPHHENAKNLIRLKIFDKMKPESEYSLMFKALYENEIKHIL